MTLPGARLRAICARVCGARTMERLIDPVLSDVQAEYREARDHGRIWRSRWIRVAGYLAFVKAIGVYAGARTMGALRDWPAEDRRALWRTGWFSAGGMVVVTALVVLPALYNSLRGLVVDLIPQGLPIAIPLGVTLGTFCGLGGRVVSSRLRRAVLAMAFACSVASFATMAWIAPAANQAFIDALSQRVRLTLPAYVAPAKGPNEMAIGELRRLMNTLTVAGRPVAARNAAVMYHTRLALPCAAFVLTLFALSVMPRRPVRRGLLVAATCVAVATYGALLVIATKAGRYGPLPVVLATWLPNLVFVLAATAFQIRRAAQRDRQHAHD